MSFYEDGTWSKGDVEFLDRAGIIPYHYYMSFYRDGTWSKGGVEFLDTRESSVHCHYLHLGTNNTLCGCK